MKVEIWIPIAPVAKQRARLTRRRRGRPSVAYTPQPTKNFETAIADVVKTKLGETLMPFGKHPVCVDIEVHAEGFLLTVEHAHQSVRPIGIRGDLDNYIKSICDGVNQVMWHDDKQVELLNVRFVGEPRKGTLFLEETCNQTDIINYDGYRE